jgi:hypothetical protein
MIMLFALSLIAADGENKSSLHLRPEVVLAPHQ